MFYSHEILTSRKHGFGTVWLAATLGSHSGVKKLKRREILDVDIPEACTVVTEAEAPMALRLQSHLLYGISRVFSLQCVYVLGDAQSAQATVKNLFNALKTSSLDEKAGQAKNERLVLQDDPAFDPDTLFQQYDVAITSLDIFSGSSQLAPSLTQSSQQTDSSFEGGMPGLIIPPSESGDDGLGGFLEASVSRDTSGQYSIQRLAAFDEDDDGGGYLPDVGFNFDTEGHMIEQPNDPATERSKLVGIANQSLQLGQIPGQDNQMPLHHARSASAANETSDMYMTGAVSATGNEQMSELSANPSSELSSVPTESAQAQEQRVRRSKPRLPIDRETLIPNSTLRDWSTHYEENMAKARHLKAVHRIPAQAKKNANVWVFGNGLTMSADSQNVAAPLATLAGNVFQKLKSAAEDAKSRKRHSPSNRSPSPERRVRRRGESEDQIGRGAAHETGLEDAINEMGFDDSIELGRDAPPGLPDDNFSQMPWNLSSRAGSAQPGSRHDSATRSRALSSAMLAGGRLSSTAPRSAGTAAGAAGLAAFLERRGCRVTSASPLLRAQASRSGRASGPQLPGREPSDAGDLEHDGELGDGLMGDLGLGGYSDNSVDVGDGFQLPPSTSPGALPRVSGVGSNSSSALDRDGRNFLMFVNQAISQQGEQAQTGGGGVIGSNDDENEAAGVTSDRSRTIEFEQLLPPDEHARPVAAQAFAHVLSLATRGLLQAMASIDLPGHIRNFPHGGPFHADSSHAGSSHADSSHGESSPTWGRVTLALTAAGREACI